MMTDTKNSYIRTIGSGESWRLHIDPLPTKFDNLFVESCRAAEEIYDMRQGKVHILYSGGIDSEHCLSIFTHLGMDVTPVIIKINPGYNDHDTEYAFKFCESKNIKPLVIDIDFLHFIDSGKFSEIFKEMKTSAFGRAPIAYAASLLDGTVILGDGEPYIKLNETDNTWYMMEEEHDFSIYKYFQSQGIHGVPHYTRYTPEMFMAYMTDPRMIELANNQLPGKLSSHTSRPFIYNRHSGFDLQPRNKYNGFEHIHLFEEIQKRKDIFFELKEYGLQYDGSHNIPYHELMKHYLPR